MWATGVEHPPTLCGVCGEPADGYVQTADGLVCRRCEPVAPARTRAGCGHWFVSPVPFPAVCDECAVSPQEAS